MIFRIACSKWLHGNKDRRVKSLGETNQPQTLFGQWADPNKSEKGGFTPLIRAAGAGSLPVVQLLIERGADVHLGDIDGFTSLMCAAGAGHADVVRFLIHKGAQLIALMIQPALP